MACRNRIPNVSWSLSAAWSWLVRRQNLLPISGSFPVRTSLPFWEYLCLKSRAIYRIWNAFLDPRCNPRGEIPRVRAGKAKVKKKHCVTARQSRPIKLRHDVVLVIRTTLWSTKERIRSFLWPNKVFVLSKLCKCWLILIQRCWMTMRRLVL